jgi:hypothetical protein
VHDLLESDRRLTIHEVAQKVRIFHGLCQAILTKNMGINYVSARLVPQTKSS